MRRVVAAVLAACALMPLAPLPTFACSPHVPTFDEVVASARAIVYGRIVEVDNRVSPDYNPHSVTVAVDRVLLGEADDMVVVESPTTVCGDGVRVRKGRRVIVALDMPWFDEVIAPYWSIYRGRVYEGGSEETPRVKTLDELADRIAALPDTATDEQSESAGASGAWLLVVAGLTALLFLIRPVGPTRQRASAQRR